MVPAYATTWTTLYPAENIDSVFYQGNFRCVRYRFNRTPVIYCPNAGSDSGSIQILPSPGSSSQIFYIYPLGYKTSSGPPLSSNSSNVAIDVTEFKSNVAFTVESTIFFQLDVNYSTYDQYLDERYTLAATWYFHGYNSSGAYVGGVASTTYSYNGTLQDVSNEQYTVELPVSVTISPMTLADKVSYVVPVCSVSYVITEDEADLSIDYWRLTCDDFNITTRTDMLLQESLTLQAIEGQLGDLNDKTDTLINGTPEQNQAAQDTLDQTQDIGKEFNVLMAQLDELGESDTSTVMGAMQDFLEEDGWQDLRVLVAPVLDWKYFITIALIVLSLVNLSIILFGR